ncbi:MAG: histidine triad nucleotide-binding protein [Desulfopila sp.]
MSDCLFCKIVAGEIPADKIYEDDEVLAFWDISPAAPKHFLIIPKLHLINLSNIKEEHDRLIGKMMRVAGQVAKDNGITTGYRTIINNDADAGQVVFHLHMHVLGGRPMGWPPG